MRRCRVHVRAPRLRLRGFRPVRTRRSGLGLPGHLQERTMARAYGSSAYLLMKRETAYGQAAASDYTIDFDEESVVERLNELTSGKGPE
jgi:hypothetical protein